MVAGYAFEKTTGGIITYLGYEYSMCKGKLHPLRKYTRKE
ncbi:unnamed protein product [marine sediment metagenome]|uniref:Uncharacterized protein n=1 Tax=marine sediment metagenome TaxID=412755 RepID=X0TZB8_9ZZZZ